MQLIPAIVTLFLSLASAGNPNINGATAEGNVNYLISFQDDATADHINGVKEWIKEKEGQVVDTVNESYVKYMVAAMDDKIRKPIYIHLLIYS